MTRIVLPFNKLKAMLLFAAKKDIREYLNGICFEFNGSPDHAIMVAADDVRILAVRETHVEDAPTTPTRIVVRRAALDKLKAPAGAMAELYLSATEASVRVGGMTADLKVEVDGFPNWKRIVPSTVSGEVAQFNPAFVMDAIKAAELMGWNPKNGVVPILHNGDKAAVFDFGPDADAFGLLMPVRVKTEYVQLRIPAWTK